jgi:hypothetical protein
VLLDPADIVVNLHHAYRRPEFQSGHYTCFHTGPSATADIEGVLIHGAQGVRSLSVIPIARAGHNAGADLIKGVGDSLGGGLWRANQHPSGATIEGL